MDSQNKFILTIYIIEDLTTAGELQLRQKCQFSKYNPDTESTYFWVVAQALVEDEL